MKKGFVFLLSFFLVLGCVSKKKAETLENKEGFIDVTGGKVWYKIVGIGKGIPLLLVHGGPGMTHYYLEPLADLGDERPIVFYDQLGCGKSERPNNPSLWTINHYVEELGQVRKALKLDRIHILGHSWGGSLTIEYMLTRPDGVVSVILSSPLVSTSRWEQDQRAYLAALSNDIQEKIRKNEQAGTTTSQEYQDAIMVFYNRHFCRTNPWPDYLNKAFAETGTDVYNYMWGPSEFTCKGTLKTFERIDNLNEIKQPILFTCGRYDEATPETMSLCQKLVPGSKIVIFENSGHATFIDDKEANLEAIRDFLHEVEKK